MSAVSLYWLAAGIAFLLGVLVSSWWLKRTEKNSNQLSDEYFKGLNFVLNEQPDKAIEVFIKALEVDSETVELHLALGGLFRRKGQVDRATRIHQNLIARPNLSENHRLQAIDELAQDYYKAGLLDRAENLYIELRESSAYRSQALEGLCKIYQQQSDWKKAIDVSKAHRRAERPQYSTRVAHFWCEMAEEAIAVQDFDSARSLLRSALSEDRNVARATLLRGEVFYQQGDYARALDLWSRLNANNTVLVGKVVDKMIHCYQELGNISALKQFLSNDAPIPREKKAFNQWLVQVRESFGQEGAEQLILSHIEQDKVRSESARHISKQVANSEWSQKSQLKLLQNLLSRAKKRKIEYNCQRCGFEAKSLHWLCPNCGEWESFV